MHEEIAILKRFPISKQKTYDFFESPGTSLCLPLFLYCPFCIETHYNPISNNNGSKIKLFKDSKCRLIM